MNELLSKEDLEKFDKIKTPATEKALLLEQIMRMAGQTDSAATGDLFCVCGFTALGDIAHEIYDRISDLEDLVKGKHTDYA